MSRQNSDRIIESKNDDYDTEDRDNRPIRGAADKVLTKV